MSCVVGVCKLKAVSVEGDFGVVIDPDQGVLTEDEGVPEDMAPPSVDFGHPVYAPLEEACNVSLDHSAVELDSRRYDDGTLRPSPDTHRLICFEDRLYLFAHDLAEEAPDPSEPERPLTDLQLYTYEGAHQWMPLCEGESISQERLARLGVGRLSPLSQTGIDFHLMSHQPIPVPQASGVFEQRVLRLDMDGRSCEQQDLKLSVTTVDTPLNIQPLSFAFGDNINLRLWRSSNTSFGEPLSVAYLDLYDMQNSRQNLCELEVEDEEGFKTLDSWSLTVGRGWLAWLNILQNPNFGVEGVELIDQAPKLTLSLYHAPIKESLAEGSLPLCDPSIKQYELKKLASNYSESVQMNPRGLINLTYDPIKDRLAFCVPNIDGSCQLNFLSSPETGGTITWPVVKDEPVRLEAGRRLETLDGRVAYVTYNPQTREDELRLLSPCELPPVEPASASEMMSRALCYRDELFVSRIKLSEVRLMMLNGDPHVVWVELKNSGWVLRSKSLN
jgi:hypothetical protein